MTTTESTPAKITTANRCAEGYEEKSIDPPYDGYMCLNINATQPVSTTTKTTKTTTTLSPCNCSCPPTGTSGVTSISGVTYYTSTTSYSVITFISGLLISIILSI